MNRFLHFFILFAFLMISACSTPAMPVATQTPEMTILFTQTPKPIPTATFTPTPDLTILGQPEKPFPNKWKKPSYNEKD